MYTVLNCTDKWVYVASNRDLRKFSVGVFKRAKTQKDRPGRIRKPVQVVVNGRLFIFIRKQWVKGKLAGEAYERFCKEIPYLYRWEMNDRHRDLTRRYEARNERIVNRARIAGRSKRFERY